MTNRCHFQDILKLFLKIGLSRSGVYKTQIYPGLMLGARCYFCRFTRQMDVDATLLQIHSIWPHKTTRQNHTLFLVGLSQRLDYCKHTIPRLLIRWSRVRISPDPPALLSLASAGLFYSLRYPSKITNKGIF